MPYIPEPERRAVYSDGARTIGQLNFEITMAALAWLQKHEVNYTNMNAVMGAFEAAKNEFYRRVVAPYEDKKRDENGEVYGPWLTK